jgi:drug/metabolite transporter (DMT)-like permease
VSSLQRALCPLKQQEYELTMDNRFLTISCLLALGLIWGASFALQRVAAPSFGPIPLVCIRLTLGAAILLPFLWRARGLLSHGIVLRLAAVSLLSQSIPFLLFAWAAERAPAAIGAITNSLTAPFAALVGVVAFGERISWTRVGGIVLGFMGVLVLVGIRFSQTDIALAALAGVLGALCYSIAAQVVARHFRELPPTAIAAVTLSSGGVLTVAPAVVAWPHVPPNSASWASVIVLGVACTGVAYVMLFWLLARIGAARATAVTYLIPLFGVVLAWLFLGERPGWNVAGGGVLILAGVAMSQSRTECEPGSRWRGDRPGSTPRVIRADHAAL